LVNWAFSPLHGGSLDITQYTHRPECRKQTGQPENKIGQMIVCILHLKHVSINLSYNKSRGGGLLKNIVKNVSN